ncbi:hypothetical protein N7530_001037 [Penicillium desertorum]|uniref:Uncharacterized protein n=1 Tax=Penicillium desertorum TaxID=1303715 RepID=A0A9X0BW77_9EURO|nr:hypothetical protein N7530_001037 [Penicillium desertorum]
MEEAVTPLSAPPMQSLACPGDNQSTFIPQRIQPTAEESDVDQEEATMDIKNALVHGSQSAPNPESNGLPAGQKRPNLV